MVSIQKKYSQGRKIRESVFWLLGGKRREREGLWKNCLMSMTEWNRVCCMMYFQWAKIFTESKNIRRLPKVIRSSIDAAGSWLKAEAGLAQEGKEEVCIVDHVKNNTLVSWWNPRGHWYLSLRLFALHSTFVQKHKLNNKIFKL